MEKELEKIEVVRFETSYDDGTLDMYTEQVRSLCKAFGLNFKIIDQHLEGAEVLRYYEIFISASSFLVEDLRHVIKTFILTYHITIPRLTNCINSSFPTTFAAVSKDITVLLVIIACLN